MKILLDTNFLLIPGKHKVDIFRELEKFGKPELFTLDLVIRELRTLASGRGRSASNARLGLELIEKKAVQVLESRGDSADQEIERVAAEQGFAVCTQDRALQARLRREGLTVFQLRQSRRVVKL
jgi:rRNA-processing protein FCF1